MVRDGVNHGGRGISFQLRMCMYLMVIARKRNWKQFKLRYEVEAMEKFDDIVFEKDKDLLYIFQAKHISNNNKGITYGQVFPQKRLTKKHNFSLLKYVKSLNDVIKKVRPKKNIAKFKSKLKYAYVLTNSYFELNAQKQLRKSKEGKFITPIEDALANHECMDFSPHKGNQIVQQPITQNQREFDSKFLRLTDEVLEILQNSLRNNNIKEYVGDLTNAEITDALNYIIYAVEQPNDVQLRAIIKEELKKYFMLRDVDSFYNDYEAKIQDWCFIKEPLTNQQMDQNIINFVVTDAFFQNNISSTSIIVELPVTSFVGRENELIVIKRVLGADRCLFINGLLGAGKTQLVRKYVERYGQSDFYGKVIWIDARSDASVVDSIKRLSDKLQLNIYLKANTRRRSGMSFDYEENFFDEVISRLCDVLFVFDNFNENLESKFIQVLIFLYN